MSNTFKFSNRAAGKQQVLNFETIRPINFGKKVWEQWVQRYGTPSNHISSLMKIIQF